MKKILFSSVFLLPFFIFSQYKWDFGGGLGVSNYLGDIGGKENTRRDFVADLKMAKTRVNVNAFARMKFYRVRGLYFKTEFNYLMIEGADKLSSNDGRMYRNLDFRNNIVELSGTFQYAFYENLDMGGSYRFRNTMRAYVFGGLGLYHHDPKGMYNGEWVKLRPLMTEGKKYSAFGISIPAGIGLSYTYKKRHRFSWEMNWRTTFTDYLDDISTVYVDPSVLPSSTAVAMANKTDVNAANSYRAGFADNFLPGSKRGDPSHNDTYLTTNVSYSYVFRGKRGKFWPNRGCFFCRRPGIRSKF